MKKFIQLYILPESDEGRAIAVGVAIGAGISVAAHLGLRAAHAIAEAL